MRTWLSTEENWKKVKPALDDSVMYPWVAILGFLLLLTDGVTSYPEVIGVVGQSVRLPCFYEGKVTSMCWGRGKCPWIDCKNTIISTDGYKVTKQKNERYTLKGDIGRRDVSLTIKNAVPSDSGLYCCRIRKWFFNDEENIIKLTIKPAPPTTTTSPSITTESTRTSTTSVSRTANTTTSTRNTTNPERKSTTTVVTNTHMTTGASTSALPLPTPTDDLKPASSSSPSQTTGTPSTCPHKTNVTHPPWHSYTTAGGNVTVVTFPSAVCCSIQTGIYIGISVTVLALLLMVLVFMISKRSLCLGDKMRLLCMSPLKESHIGALKNATMKPVRAEDNIYVMDDVL
ncbi:hepatitis A virus cellular receptor 1 homolog [Moschus berezovskii]|uniref:hepatitis A virus cellular receptor 1 homolog n=1 Tax=Moschus berezovskii TaxID=68408 RepID=UPI0024450850|nr:hepatitis A virus cellular receptor 1 homolog [Moschus berezovskii]